MLDLSKSKKIKGANHWYSEISQLYHPTGVFPQDSQEIVYSSGVLNVTKFVPILLKEWFYLVKKKGYLIIDYKPNKICDSIKLEKKIWWLWKGQYEIIFHNYISNSEIEDIDEQKLKNFIKDYPKQNIDKNKSSTIRFICKKIKSTKALGDSIDKWTFGIITNGKRPDWVKRIADSISKLHVPQYEIVVCGTYSNKLEENLIYIPFNKRDERGWITRKKNIILENAKFENICILHDRVILDKNWYKGMVKWGNTFEHLSCIQAFKGKRVADWLLHERLDNIEFSFASLLDYKDWDWNVYQPGQIHILKKRFAVKVLWDETYYWQNPEDLKISNQLRDLGYILRLNPYIKADILAYKFGALPEVPFCKSKLSSVRVGNYMRIFLRHIYSILYRIPIFKGLMIRIFFLTAWK